ncbi:MAG: hypothetical protein EBZ77_01510 [Chitinophagia bacterium]|nr:hypothetical protein [Chitinophagia bacterium]
MRKLIVIVASLLVIQPSYAQRMSKYRLPSPESALYDNNGKDLYTFIKNSKQDLLQKGEVVDNASLSDWAYLQYQNVKVPATDKSGNLNYTEAFDVTLLVASTTRPAKATWWAREYNSAKGKFTWFDRGGSSDPALPVTKYDAFINEVNTRKLAFIEYIDTVPNLYDFDDMFKNCLFVKHGAISNASDYTGIVKYYKNQIDQFLNTSGAPIGGSFFISCYKNGKDQYVAYLDVINNKVTGNLVKLEAPFENDRIKFVNSLLRNRQVENLYLYGEDEFGLFRIIRKKLEANDNNTTKIIQK